MNCPGLHTKWKGLTQKSFFLRPLTFLSYHQIELGLITVCTVLLKTICAFCFIYTVGLPKGRIPKPKA